jgi:hypothetical protein
MTALIRIDRSWTAAPGDERSRPIRFCSRCGQPGPEDTPRGKPFSSDRVCRLCEMGLMLTCSREALPGAAVAFMIVTFELRISAVSEAGEKVFGPERSLIRTPLLDVLTSPMGDDALARHVAGAAQRACDPVVLPVRLASPRARQVGTMAGRVATCGPPRAALITVEPSGFGRS